MNNKYGRGFSIYFHLIILKWLIFSRCYVFQETVSLETNFAKVLNPVVVIDRSLGSRYRAGVDKWRALAGRGPCYMQSAVQVWIQSIVRTDRPALYCPLVSHLLRQAAILYSVSSCRERKEQDKQKKARSLRKWNKFRFCTCISKHEEKNNFFAFTILWRNFLALLIKINSLKLNSLPTL